MTECDSDFLNEEEEARLGQRAARPKVEADQGAETPEAEKWNLARRPFPDLEDRITVSRVMDAAAPTVLSAMEAVVPGEPYRLALVDQRGDPLTGGVLVFDIQGCGAVFPWGLAREAAWSAVRQVFISVRLIEGAAPSCELLPGMAVGLLGYAVGNYAGLAIAALMRGVLGG